MSPVRRALCNITGGWKDGCVSNHERPAADVSVRVGWADDAPGIAAVQVRAWREEYAGVLPPEVLGALEPGELAAAWQASLNHPKDARNRVQRSRRRPDRRG